jgi:hypothetical protein
MIGRILVLAGAVFLLSACGSAPQIIEPQSAPHADTEIPPGYGLGSITRNGQEVDAYTMIKSLLDGHVEALDENTLALFRSALTEKEIASLSPAKQRALRAARFKVEAQPSQPPLVEVRREGQPIDLYEALRDTPVIALANFPDTTKAAIYRALTPQQRDQLPADKREILERSIQR